MQLVAKDNSQAAFRLAQIGPHYILMKHLAEAETLVLMNATATSPSEAVPLTLKVIDAGDAKKAVDSTSGVNGKGKGGATADVPCKWFCGDTGCRAGKQCRWSHAWDNIPDKAARCRNCGSKEHRKTECPVK